MAELVGGAFLSSFMQILFDRLTFNGAQKGALVLKSLKEIMMLINPVLLDAEEKQISVRAVKTWLLEVKDALYEADDLLDEIAYETLRSKLVTESQKQQKWNFFPSASSNPLKKKVEEKLESVLQRIQFLAHLKDALGLVEYSAGEQSPSFRVPTTPLVDDQRIYGRDDDKEAAMELLLSDDINDDNLGVISIVGMGGLGKTTLAQLLFNDSRASERFDLRLWVCVSEEFDVLKVSKYILEFFNLEASDSFKGLKELQQELMERLSGKRFLLVLDDVWNEDRYSWEVLWRPLNCGAKGSKIVVTTRSFKVASIMSTAPPYVLGPLTGDDCWRLFSLHAFHGNFDAHPELKEIGKQIVHKCRGVPLAAKVIGGLLRYKRNVGEWMNILHSNAWDLADGYVLPSLRLQYLHLPSHLKQCFTYCAIFPQDYEFQMEELILLWMAEGFLDQTREHEKMVVGYGFFNDLVLRSFFQESYRRSCFIMHDLVNDLAQLESQEFCFRLERNRMDGVVSKKTRHLSFVMSESNTSEIFDRIYEEAPFLRTFVSLERLSSSSSKHINNKVLHDLVSKLHRLRVLSLSGYNSIDRLPDPIGNLIHLRYLNVSRMSIRKLPDSVCNLYNLQTLILLWCEYLIELPAKMGQLINLCYLEIARTKLQEMPPRMGKLMKLQKLTYFIVGRQSESTLKELAELQQLQGEFCIQNLQNVVDVQDASKANLRAKKQLKKLELRWDAETDDTLQDLGVLLLLQPHTNLKCLSIVGYGGTRFPNWVGDPSFANIVILTLRRCKYCSVLPPLGRLESLKELSIIAFDMVEAVGPEFYGSSTARKTSFGSLEILRFERMLNWREWYSYEQANEGAAFPLLQELYLIECPNLVKALPSHLPSLKILGIERCQKLLADSLPRAPSVLQMKLKDDDNHHVLLEESENEIRNWELLKSFSSKLFPMVEALRIITCPNLNSVSASERHYGDFTLLDSMEIGGCRDLLSFSEGGLTAQNLTRLSLWGFPNLKSLPQSMHSSFPSLVALQISDCPELELFPAGGLPSKLQSLEIDSCNKLIAGRLGWDLQLLPSLSHFRIGMNDDVESFPEKTLLPSSLASLEIEHFQNLQCLDYEGLQQLTLLKQLTICNCPKLQSMPEEGLPKSLSSLSICNCLLLERRCQWGKGEDWPKISHVSCVKINYHKIN
ncbi:putative disease resistance protein At3g14460 [Ricinus communis]|uniref:putative disease resistance protein At3g14460 n=1 Tax=Ricinus communis TaxID=3988 RepID=UPI00201AC0E5|nr:putative disease resistance protein At3g14460 [Ricinus communis]XP_015570754.2 putative disease resistance protein At3g14460 [Ricinus communis]XP_015570755.2 putative disease resistance protein At3g14460 [Ricinus communis]XP_025011991.2 putative disease resistance protein At3g14460 [Ricinus communis]